MTNFERIRIMTMDELVEILSNTSNCDDFCAYGGTSGCKSYLTFDFDYCRKGIKIWLEQEAEE